MPPFKTRFTAYTRGLFLCLAILAISAPPARAQGSAGGHNPNKVPEIDGTTARSALTLLLFGTLLFVRPMRRRASNE